MFMIRWLFSMVVDHVWPTKMYVSLWLCVVSCGCVWLCIWHNVWLCVWQYVCEDVTLWVRLYNFVVLWGFLFLIVIVCVLMNLRVYICSRVRLYVGLCMIVCGCIVQLCVGCSTHVRLWRGIECGTQGSWLCEVPCWLHAYNCMCVTVSLTACTCLLTMLGLFGTVQPVLCSSRSILIVIWKISTVREPTSHFIMIYFRQAETQFTCSDSR